MLYTLPLLPHLPSAILPALVTALQPAGQRGGSESADIECYRAGDDDRYVSTNWNSEMLRCCAGGKEEVISNDEKNEMGCSRKTFQARFLYPQSLLAEG